MDCLLIYNPFANGGHSNQILKKVEAFLQEHSIGYDTKSTPSKKGEQAPNYSEYRRVIILGGDGTLHRVLNYWGIPPLPVCLISAGSGNDFSRLSHKSASLKAQLNQFLENQTYPCDLGQCNGVWFATGVGIGFDGRVAQTLQKNSRFKGHLAYMLVVIMQIFSYKETEMRVVHDEGEEKEKGLLLTVGNGSEFGGGFKVTPQASFQDGLFQCCWIKEISLIQRILHLSKVEKGTHQKLPFVKMFDTKSLELHSKELLTCHMDGEVYQWCEFKVSMHPGALTLIGSPGI